MRSWKRIGMLLLAGAMALGMAGCGGSGGGDGKTISYITHDKQAGFTGVLYEAVKAAGEKEGFTVDFYDGKVDSNEQIDLMNQVIEKKPAAIVLLPNDAAALTPSVPRHRGRADGAGALG